MTEYNNTLRAVLQKAEDFGITFNREKCEFGVDEIDFYIQLQIHEAWAETDGRKGQSSHRQQTSRNERSRQKFPRNGGVFVQVHRQIFINNCPIKKIDREKRKI